MSHVSVYRRWRPQSFEELIGQERITRTLQNAIRAGRTSHAYLFAGYRGTGKTTTARILAKALNCAGGPTPTPCNGCARCDSIARGISMDVIEIDGASNTSVDDVRDLKEKIVLVPTEGRYKVYIIDEVHMLSTSAFNALLKTLEEPPAHAIFILVTTEPHRIPPTVLSRCQRFDFRRVSFKEITARLGTIAEQEGMKIDSAALAQIARNADGSVRDAESVLDQLSAYTEGEIDRNLVIGVLGLVDDETAAAFVEAVLDRNVGEALRLAQQAADAGKDIRQVLRTLLEYFRDLLVAKTCGQAAPEVLDVSREQIAGLLTQAEKATISDLLRAVRVLNDAVGDARWSTQPRLALEVALIRLARPEMDPTLEGVLARLDRLEGGGGGGVRNPSQPTDEPKGAAGPARDAAAEQGAPPGTPHLATASPDPPLAGVGPVTLEEVRRQWARVLEQVKRSKMFCHALLIEGTPVEVRGDMLVVGLRSGYNFHVDNLHRPENRTVVEGALERVLSRPLRFQCRLHEEGAGQSAAGAAPGETSLLDRAKELFSGEIIEDE